MIEVSIVDMLLLIWAVAASAVASHYIGRYRRSQTMVNAAAEFTRAILVSEKLYASVRKDAIAHGVLGDSA